MLPSLNAWVKLLGMISIMKSLMLLIFSTFPTYDSISFMFNDLTSMFRPLPGLIIFAVVIPIDNANTVITMKYVIDISPILPTCFKSPIADMPDTKVRNIIGPIISLMIFIKISANGLVSMAMFGKSIPTTIPIQIPRITWKYNFFISLVVSICIL